MCYIDRYKTGIIGNALKSNTPVPASLDSALPDFTILLTAAPPPTLFLSAASRARVRTRRRT